MKRPGIIFIIIISCCTACNSQQKPIAEKKDNGSNKKEVIVTKGSLLPFVGKRGFETRPGVSGTGTPHRFVEIMKNGDVFFSFEQENQADGTITKERYYAGKYQQYMKCVFKKLDDEKTFYEFSRYVIYEVDGNKNRLKNEECCSNSGTDEGKKECTCKSEFSE